MLKKLLSVFVLFLGLLGLGTVHAEELQQLPFHGQYTSDGPNNGIAAIYFEQDRVIFSFVKEIDKGNSKSPSKNGDMWAKAVGSAQKFNTFSADQKAQAIKALQDYQPNVMLYFNGIQGYNSRYGEVYLEFKNPTFKKVDNQYVITEKQSQNHPSYLEKAEFILTEKDGILTDAQGGTYKKALPIHWIIGGFLAVVVVAVALIATRKKKLIG